MGIGQKISKPATFKPVHKDRKSVLILILIFAAIGAVVYFAYPRFDEWRAGNGRKHKSGDITNVKTEEKGYSNAIDKNLQKGNVDSYQNAQLELANGYIVEDNFSSAERLLDKVKQNVPSDKLNIYYYSLRVQIDHHNKDKASEKADLTTLIDILKKQGLTEQASVYQKQLNALGQ